MIQRRNELTSPQNSTKKRTSAELPRLRIQLHGRKAPEQLHSALTSMSITTQSIWPSHITSSFVVKYFAYYLRLSTHQLEIELSIWLSATTCWESPVYLDMPSDHSWRWFHALMWSKLSRLLPRITAVQYSRIGIQNYLSLGRSFQRAQDT